MEILKFDESGASSPARKRSGRGAILVTFVALVFGAGTALASGTLTVNGPDNEIQLTQAVAETAQCDENVNIGLETVYSGTGFKLSKVKVSEIDDAACASKFMKIRVYPSTGDTPVAFCVGDADCIDMGTSYVKQITVSVLDFAITTPSLVVANKSTIGKVTVEITDTDPRI
jgi:hypothetical protein